MTTNRRATTGAVLVALFMGAMEATVVATAMPTVVADLGGLDLYGWVTAIYMLGTTVSIPLYGKLADVYGRRPVMLTALSIFLLGSMASGTAQTMTMLIAYRGVQALGAGGLQSLSFTIVGDIYTAEERARIQGIFGAVWGVAGIIGPFLGGIIVRALSWRWVFYINVPLGLVCAGLLIGYFHEHVERRERTLDVLGAVLLASAVVALLLGVSRVAPHVTLPIAAVLTAVFLFVERRASDPVLPLAILKRRIIAAACAIGAVIGATMIATVVYLPLLLQAVLGLSPTQSGSTLAPMMLAAATGSAIGGRLLARVRYRTLIGSGMSLVLVATIAIALLGHEGSSAIALGGAMLVFGIGFGFANSSVVIAVQEAVDWKERGVATAATAFFRTIGGSVSIGALGAILAASLPAGVPDDVVSNLFGPEHGRHLDPAVLAPLATSIQAGLGRVFWVIVALAASGVAVAMTFPNVRMKTRRGAAPASPAPSGATPEPTNDRAAIAE